MRVFGERDPRNAAYNRRLKVIVVTLGVIFAGSLVTLLLALYFIGLSLLEWSSLPTFFGLLLAVSSSSMLLSAFLSNSMSSSRTVLKTTLYRITIGTLIFTVTLVILELVFLLSNTSV